MLSAGGLTVAVLAVYWNSLGAPFIFDDIHGVERNATIRQLWPPWQALNPPGDGSGVSGRPLVNLSLAVNYALGGLDVRGYHAMNLGLHMLATLTLWGVLRRTLRLGFAGRDRLIPPAGEDRRGAATPPDNNDAELFAWSAALFWAVHPLLTESVVCVIQRNEILGSLFYLLTIYCFVRGVEVGRVFDPPSSVGPALVAGPRRSDLFERERQVKDLSYLVWLGLSFLACLAGVASKEIVATAPLLVFLYDCTFVAGTFRAAWQQRKKYYLALAGTWLLLGWLVWRNQQRGGTVGFGLGLTPWEYLLTQCRALVLYLKLSVWPHPLVLDYGWPTARNLGEVWWQALVVLSLLLTTVWALDKKPRSGFLLASFFIMLAPSSSFVPLTTQTIAEHRMYLPLAAVVILLLGGLYALAGRKALLAALAGAVALGTITVKRNQDYRTELALWTDTVAKRPANARAHGNLSRAYLNLGRWAEAIAASREQLRVDPEYKGDAHADIGRALTELGRVAEAVPWFEEGLRLRPDSFDVHNNYGVALAALSRWPEAVAQYELALRLRPDFVETHNNLANALGKVGRVPEALAHYETALRLQPDFIDAEVNWGRALAESGRAAEARSHFEKVLRERPDAAAHADLATALAAAGRAAEAIPHYEAALRLRPDSALTRCGLGNVLARLGRIPEAILHYEAALRVQPDLADAQHNLAVALMQQNRPAEARPHFEATVRLLPGSADAHHELALVLGELRRWNEAAQHEEEALRLRPDFAEAREHLARLRGQ